MKRKTRLTDKYSPSPPCTCEVCVGYCARPGWWTVKEAAASIEAGYAGRMMVELSPDRTFGVLAPAFRGNEVDFALSRHAPAGCGFLANDRCELHGTPFQPLECRVCHHDRPGLGPQCHADIEKDWNSYAGRSLIGRWARLTGFLDALELSYGRAPAGIAD
jgi:hypothetical protein